MNRPERILPVVEELGWYTREWVNGKPLLAGTCAKAADLLEEAYRALVEIEALCHSETRQRLLAICETTLSHLRGDGK